MIFKQKKIGNILAIRNDRFGEFLLNIPALRALKETFPQANLTLAVSKEVKELAECMDCADTVAVWDDNFKKEIRNKRFDTCVIMNPTKEAHWLSFWAGIPRRIGYDRKCGILLTHKIKDEKGLGLKHEVEYNLDLVGLIGAKTTDKTISLRKLPSADKSLYGKAIAIHPFTSDPVKQWPVDRFRQLAKIISDEFGLKILIVGKETVFGREMFERLGNNIVNLINSTSLVELSQALKQCKLLISCDSGPMHLAAAAGVPVLALFRNDLPGKAAKRWGPWGEGHTVIERNNPAEISVEEVLAKARGILR